MVARDVETLPRPVVLHLGAQERRWVEEVVAPVGEGKSKIVLFPESEEDVEDGAARSLVGLHEHDVHLGGARLGCRVRKARCFTVLQRLCNTERTCFFLGDPVNKWHCKIYRLTLKKNCFCAVFNLPDSHLV